MSTEAVSGSITVLGSTGSIGVSTLDVVARQPGYSVYALTAFNNIGVLLEQCRRFEPRFAVVVDPQCADELRRQLRDSSTEVLVGADKLDYVAAHPDVQIVMAAIVGAAGLKSTLAAVSSGKKVLLANKESLVMAGDLFMQSVRENGAQLLPIDSEHNAIFQCLPAPESGMSLSGKRGVRKVLLTASGGPFLNMAVKDLATVTPEQACRHPRWKMGRKISVDSATLMNKGLEYIEACYLFDLQANQLDVLIHPQSIIHSMVEYRDGSVLAQMANPDMRVPIAHGLAWPDRIESGVSSLNLAVEDALEFHEPDLKRFPCLALGIDVSKVGGTAATLLNAANEVAVQAFLDRQLGFSSIHRIIQEVMSKIPCGPAASLDMILDADARARELANKLIYKDNI